MPYIITNTRNHPIQAYVFDPRATLDKISADLVTLESAEMGVTDKLQTTLIMTQATQAELAHKNVPIFDTKKEAKVFYTKLALSTCRYVMCVKDTPDARRNKTSLNNQMIG